MLFLFAGEMIASTDGLAYRIALLRRHMGMDVIIPYVLWVALLLFLVDLGMRGPTAAASLVPRIMSLAAIVIDTSRRPATARRRGRTRPAQSRESRKASSLACWGRPAAASPPCCGCCLAPSVPRTGRILIQTAREHEQPDRSAATCRSAKSLLPDRTVLDNITTGSGRSVNFGLLCDASLPAAFYRRRREFSRRGPRVPAPDRPARGRRRKTCIPTKLSGGMDAARRRAPRR
jgi:hypothetical protein